MILNERTRQAIRRNCSDVVDFLERKFRKTPIHLQETPCYFYKGNKSKLEITVLPDPRVAKVNVRITGIRSFDREPYFQSSYDLDGLSIAVFQRDIDDLISRMD